MANLAQLRDRRLQNRGNELVVGGTLAERLFDRFDGVGEHGLELGGIGVQRSVENGRRERGGGRRENDGVSERGENGLFGQPDAELSLQPAHEELDFGAASGDEEALDDADFAALRAAALGKSGEESPLPAAPARRSLCRDRGR